MAGMKPLHGPEDFPRPVEEMTTAEFEAVWELRCWRSWDYRVKDAFTGELVWNRPLQNWIYAPYLPPGPNTLLWKPTLEQARAMERKIRAAAAAAVV